MFEWDKIGDPEVLAALKRLLHGRVIDLAETDGLPPRVKQVICVPMKCYDNCSHKGNCHYMAFRKGAKNSEFDFIVTNHNLLLMDAKMRAEGKTGVLPPVQMYVIDEAHQLVNAARSIYGAEFGNEAIPGIAERLLMLNYTPLSKKSHDWWEVRDACGILAERLLY